MAETKKIRTALRPALVIPLANEEENFPEFIHSLNTGISEVLNIVVYFVLDNASKDMTLELCKEVSKVNPQFKTIHETKNRNVVDAYLRGFKEAMDNGHDLIIEMDGGLSHNPIQIQHFIEFYSQGYDAIFGSRFIKGSSTFNYGYRRKFLSKTGTVLSNLMLGVSYRDGTSGFQAFDANLMKKILQYPVRSKGHFYQTEIRFLCRKINHIEIPISYNSPSAGLSGASLSNAISTLLYYFCNRLIFKSPKF
jgi:dolichol-phosphate mannosyltransferase